MPSRTMKLSGTSGFLSLAGTSGFQPERSFPLNSGMTRSGTMAAGNAGSCGEAAGAGTAA